MPQHPTVQTLLDTDEYAAEPAESQGLGTEDVPLSKIASACRNIAGGLLKTAAYWDPELGGVSVAKARAVMGEPDNGAVDTHEWVGTTKRTVAEATRENEKRIADIVSDTELPAGMKNTVQHHPGVSMAEAKKVLANLGVPSGGVPTDHVYGTKV